MSKYTTEVRFICETAAGRTESAGYTDLLDILEAGRRYIFSFTYPIFDERYRGVLENKILKHYYTREIGEETVGLWKLRLDARMNEIMPFYNKLYESELLEFNPLYDVDYTRTGDKAGNESREETTENTSKSGDAMSGTVKDDRQTAENSVNYNRETGKDTGTETRRLDSYTGEQSGANKETEHSGTDTATTNRDNLNDRWDYYSDTPQGTIGFIPGSEGTPQAQGQLANQTYLTNVRHVKDDTTGSEEVLETEYGHTINEGTTGSRETVSSGTDGLERNAKNETETTGTNEKAGTDQATKTYDTLNQRDEQSSGLTTGSARNMEEYTERVAGKMGGSSYSRMLKEFRETFLNIDMMIIDNLSDLFFGLWE